MITIFFQEINNHFYKNNGSTVVLNLNENNNNYSFIFNNQHFVIKKEDMNNFLDNKLVSLFFKTNLKKNKQNIELEIKKRDKRILKNEKVIEILEGIITHNPKFTNVKNSNFSIPLDLTVNKNYPFLDSASYFNDYTDKLDYCGNAALIPIVNFVLCLLKNKTVNPNFYSLLFQEQKDFVDFIINNTNLIFKEKKIEYKNKYKTIFIPHNNEVINISILNNSRFLVEISEGIKENKEELNGKIIKKWSMVKKTQNISNIVPLGKLKYAFKFEVKPFKENKKPFTYFLEALDYDEAIHKIIKSTMIKINDKIKNNVENFYSNFNLYFIQGYNLYYDNAKKSMNSIINKFLKILIEEFKKEELDLTFLVDAKNDIKTVLYHLNLKNFTNINNNYSNENLFVLKEKDFNDIFETSFERLLNENID